jgi:hypothetical protein
MFSMIRVSTFHGHHFIAIVSTFHDWFKRIGMWPHDCSIGFSHFPAIAQITLSSVKLSLSLSEAEWFHAEWNEAVFQSLNVFCTSKNYLYFISINSKAVDVLSFYYWFFLSSWKQIRVLFWKWVQLLVTVLATPVNHQQGQSVAPTSGILQFATAVTKAPWPLEDWQRKRNVP